MNFKLRPIEMISVLVSGIATMAVGAISIIQTRADVETIVMREISEESVTEEDSEEEV